MKKFTLFNSIYPFQYNMESKYPFFVQGVMQYQNVPKIAQLEGGIHTSRGIIGSKVLTHGVLLPEMNPSNKKVKEEKIIKNPFSDTSNFCVFDERSAPPTLKVEKNKVEFIYPDPITSVSIKKTLI